MADGSLLIRLRSIVTLSTSPECLATVKVNRMPLFRRTYTHRMGGRRGREGGGREREGEGGEREGGGREKKGEGGQRGKKKEGGRKGRRKSKREWQMS